MSLADHYHQYRWALERLAAAFGADHVTPQSPADGGQVLAVEVANPDAASDRRMYRVLLKDHLLIDLNKQSSPQAFLEREVKRAQAYFAGKSSVALTIP